MRNLKFADMVRCSLETGNVARALNLMAEAKAVLIEQTGAGFLPNEVQEFKDLFREYGIEY